MCVCDQLSSLLRPRTPHLDSNRVMDVGLNEGLELCLGTLAPLQRGNMLVPARGREVVEHGMVAEGRR